MSLIFVISNIDNNNGGVSRRVIGLLLQLLMRVLNVFFSGLDILVFFAILYKGDNFCVFRLAFLHYNPLLKGNLL